MIQSIAFLDTSSFTAMFVVKHREKMVDGILALRSIKEGDEEPSDLPILKEWKSAKALLSRVRTGAALFLNGHAATLGKAWIENLPPGAHTPWAKDESDYALAHFRTRTCIIPAPGAWSHCGGATVALAVGAVNLTDPTRLSSETNFGDHTRTHLIVDIRRPEAPGGE